MFSFFDPLPRYLLGKYQLTATVVFTALFSLMFMVVSIPFSHNAWFSLSEGEAFLVILAFFAISVLVVSVSRRLLYNYGRFRELLCLHYVLWCVAEIAVVSALYTFFSIEAERSGIIKVENMRGYVVFLSALVYVAVSLGVPYLVSALYFALEDKNNTIRLMNYGSVVSDAPVPARDEKRITLFDNSGVLKFSISSENLYYIESDDNYVQVWYMDSSGGMKQYMLRCRLKTIEESFNDSDLVRCHRKYVINISKVRVLTCEKDGYQVDFDVESVAPIPVSKTYEQAVLARFNSR